jgi:hypothetical protein
MLKLTNPYHGGETRIVPEKVTGIVDCGDTRLVSAGGDGYAVKETAEEIEKMLNETLGGKVRESINACLEMCLKQLQQQASRKYEHLHPANLGYHESGAKYVNSPPA